MARIELTDSERHYVERARRTLAGALALNLPAEEPGDGDREADRMLGRLEIVVEGLLYILDGGTVAAGETGEAS